jgi:hypothetical protein
MESYTSSRLSRIMIFALDTPLGWVPNGPHSPKSEISGKGGADAIPTVVGFRKHVLRRPVGTGAGRRNH